MLAEAIAAEGPPEVEEDRVRAAAMILGLRGRGVSDLAVLKAIETVPRSHFAPAAWRHYAYSDHPLPIACGQTISAPSTVAVMTSALEVGDRHSVLEIGTGSGYQTAVLGRLARRVTSIERFRTLARAAERRWLALGLHNISVVVGDGLLGWNRQAPFDRMLVTAACPRPPGGLIGQLSEHGILIAPIGDAGGPQRLTLFQRIGTSVDTRDLGAVRFLPAISGVALSL
jgi:protein-L-isoaspartate(D-aspartate) O-methyltransferase